MVGQIDLISRHSASDSLRTFELHFKTGCMASVPTTKRYVINLVASVSAFLAIPLWREFYEPNQPIWNVFLGVVLVAMVAGIFFGVRHLQKNAVEVGEARFPTSKSSDV